MVYQRMPFYLHITTAGGSETRLASPFSFIEDAMTVACAALRHDARDAWVEDNNGNVVADFVEIQGYCERGHPHSLVGRKRSDLLK